MKRFVLEVNEKIETHVAKEKNQTKKSKTKRDKQFVSLFDKNLHFFFSTA